MQKTEKVLASQSQERRGPWREARLMNTGEKNFSPHSALGLCSKEQRRPQARLERRPLGREGPGRPSPQASRPSAQLVRGRLVWGASPSPSPLGVGGGGEGIHQAPPPRPAATEPSGSNIPSPLKGEVTASKTPPVQSPAAGWIRPLQGGEEEHQETLPGPPIKRPQFCEGLCTWASGESSSGVRYSAP